MSFFSNGKVRENRGMEETIKDESMHGYAVYENNERSKEEFKHDTETYRVWQDRVRGMLDCLIREYELPDDTLYLSDNYGKSEKTKERIISHTVAIWEPDYPETPNMKRTQNKVVMTIKPRTGEEVEMLVREGQEADLHNMLPADAEIVTQTKSEAKTGQVKIRIPAASPYLVNFVRAHTAYCIEGYVSKAADFGCCSSFERCSDAKKCLHENRLYAKACIYRRNLENGRIYYGKNRNID